MAGRKIVIGFVLFFAVLQLNRISAFAQTPPTYTSSELLAQLKKLKVLGSVLYIAAHPDDENTRLLSWLANEKMYRTGYLSITRGDGGQNLIGDEQGIDLGLIRTQELLAARRIDGAEQFFTRAFDFGYSKSPEEALRIWNHEKILSDVVLVIRKFKPDVIICRFPTTGEGGHGHHTASAILGEEAFTAAADPGRFPEQLQQGVTIWQASRILWNSFNFGGTNTQREDHLKIDVGQFNPLLGKSYGEVAALSRSQHKSQGFGVPAQRGTVYEYFAHLKGEKASQHLFDGIETSWMRIGHKAFDGMIDSFIQQFKPEFPGKSVEGLVKFYNSLNAVKDEYWKKQKQKEVQTLIERCAGLFMESTTQTAYAVLGDSLKVNCVINNRTGVDVSNIRVSGFGETASIDSVATNTQKQLSKTYFIANEPKLILQTQPYWLREAMEPGSFNVRDQELIGEAENGPLTTLFALDIYGTSFRFLKPLQYKHTDPVKGELFQPLLYAAPLSFSPRQSLLVSKNAAVKTSSAEVIAYRDTRLTDPKLVSQVPVISNGAKVDINLSGMGVTFLKKTEHKSVPVQVKTGINHLGAQENSNGYNQQLRSINYDHIPSIHYYKDAIITHRNIDVSISGKRVGYIVGAGDKVPEALEQMGYEVQLLTENDITEKPLSSFDAIVTGIRAYNTNEWMNNVYDKLMEFVKNGGVLLVQYNTSTQLGPVKAKIAPYSFTITRNRITDETSKVEILQPNHAVFNQPNKITGADFEGWVQERSIYHAETTDSNYVSLLRMSDPGEKPHDGGLLAARYGKGRFVYTGLAFFRQLPAAVPGAYRLLANLLAKPGN